jgi:signal-transduction protein with cAMP-binding, CBS, and nucleotidyltransferase domain
MNIGDICTREVVMADQASSLQQAAVLMRQHHVGSLVVTAAAPDGAKAVGIVTDRDIVVEAVARGLDTKEAQISRLLDSKLAVVPAVATVDDAILAMKKQGVRRLLVVAEDGRVHGIVSLDDVLCGFAQEMSEMAHVVRGGIERETAERPTLPAAETRGVRVASYPRA